MRCLNILLLACFILGCYSGSLYSMTDDWKARILNTHNNARRQYGVPDLVWHSGAQSQADNWALNLANNNNCGLKHSSGSGYGENLAMWMGGSLDPSRGVQMWNNENTSWSCEPVSTYDMSGNCGGNWGNCGHYTQNIWKDTTGVGCALADCGSNRVVMSCNYYPPGNYVGRHPTGKCTTSNPNPPPPPNNPPPPPPPPPPSCATVTQTLTRTLTQTQTQTQYQTQTQTQTVTQTISGGTQTVTETQTQYQTVTQTQPAETVTVNGNGDVASTVSLTSTVTQFIPQVITQTETISGGTQTVTETQTQTQYQTVTQTQTVTQSQSTGGSCYASDGSKCIDPSTHTRYGGQFVGQPPCFDTFNDGRKFCFRTNTDTNVYPCFCPTNAMDSAPSNYEPVQMNQTKDVVLSSGQLAGVIIGCVVGVVALVVAVFFIVSKTKKYDSL